MTIRVTLPYLPEPIDWPDEVGESGWAWVTDPHHPITVEDLYPGLEVIVTASTGLNHLPIEECERRGIRVYSLLDDREGLNEIKASSEATFMLLLMTLKNAKQALNEVQNGRWQENERLFRGNELYGKEVGIIGIGRIGQNIYKWCYAFGAHVKHVYDPPAGNDDTPLEAVFADCDVVVVSCELNEETEGMIQARHIVLMPYNAVLINTARGEVLASDAELALLERPDLRVGVDVLRAEVSGAHLCSPLLKMNNVTVLPHMAGVTQESQVKAAKIACNILKNAVQ